MLRNLYFGPANATSTASYGCLYYTDQGPPNSPPAVIEGQNLSSRINEHVSARFSIGPVVDPVFWKDERSTMTISRGPCKADAILP